MIGVTCSNITFVGTGTGETTILGGFGIRNVENITFKLMTVTNTTSRGCGIRMSNAKVELVDVALNNCRGKAFYFSNNASEHKFVATRCEFANSDFGAVVHGNGSDSFAEFNNCTFHGNSTTGLAGGQSTINLYGEATAIHSNSFGIVASTSGKIVIHLPSHHNTVYNNRGEDRSTIGSGTITNVVD